MTTTIPSIACLGVIGKNSNPLHITLFTPTRLPSSSSPPSARSPSVPLLTPLQFSLLLSSTLDIFHARTLAHNSSSSANTTSGSLSGDLGLLHAIDERLAAYGYETNTGVRFVAVVDVQGREVRGGLAAAAGGGGGGGMGLREGELKVVFKAMQAAYIRLLQNPFFDPDEHSPPGGRAGKKITSRQFGEEMNRIGNSWAPGVGNL